MLTFQIELPKKKNIFMLHPIISLYVHIISNFVSGIMMYHWTHYKAVLKLTWNSIKNFSLKQKVL